MSSIKIFANQQLDHLKENHYFRKIKTVENFPNNYICLDGKKLLSFASNDYLGLKFNKQIIEEIDEITKNYCSSSCSSRLVVGNYSLIDELEYEIAKFKGYESACIFGSGYLANIGTIPVLVGKNDIVIADKFIHASQIEGIKLSGAKFIRYKHNDLNYLKQLLDLYRNKYDKCLIVSESIFSMDGTVSNISAINKIAKNYDAWVYIDDAHSTCENIDKTDILIGTFSKSFASYGGYVCSDKSTIDLIKNKARSLIYSTALPPIVIANSIVTLKYIRNNPNLYSLPKKNAQIFTSSIMNDSANSHIFSLVIGKEIEAIKLAKKFEENGFFAPAIRYPSVPKNSARLRISFCANHLEEDIKCLRAIINNL